MQRPEAVADAEGDESGVPLKLAAQRHLNHNEEKEPVSIHTFALHSFARVLTLILLEKVWSGGDSGSRFLGLVSGVSIVFHFLFSEVR
jgi:hypothetical protein